MDGAELDRRAHLRRYIDALRAELIALGVHPHRVADLRSIEQLHSERDRAFHELMAAPRHA